VEEWPASEVEIHLGASSPRSKFFSAHACRLLCLPPAPLTLASSFSLPTDLGYHPSIWVADLFSFLEGGLYLPSIACSACRRAASTCHMGGFYWVPFLGAWIYLLHRLPVLQFCFYTQPGCLPYTLHRISATTHVDYGNYCLPWFGAGACCHCAACYLGAQFCLPAFPPACWSVSCHQRRLPSAP